jgi:uncharacterized membrane protein|tara:strand:- start:48 stop:545 length:498 start_codon:yes stop_codon:yes gene_type:complete
MPLIFIAALALAPAPRASWSCETSASLSIAAPASLCLSTFSDIERMPQWSPRLESVRLIAPGRSVWKLRLPRFLRLASVEWEAQHEVVPPSLVCWSSLSGVENEGSARFDPCDDGCVFELSIAYNVGRLLQPLAKSSIVQNWVQSTLVDTMERFRLVLEDTATED